MDMTPPNPESPTIDAGALAEALSVLGLLYGARAALESAAAGAASEREAVRTFIHSERPHLLATYEIDTLVSLVMAARARNARAPASIEQFTPA